ncbi:hypothetical protein P1994_01015, partial [Xanthomonas perforans]
SGVHPNFVLQLLALIVIAPACLLLGQGITGLMFWRLDRKHAAMVSKIEQAALVAIAYREAHILRQREHDRIAAADYLDPCIVAAELRAERLSDATMCEAEWSR